MGGMDIQPLGKHSARVKELRKRVRRRVSGEVIVDGIRLVKDCLRWGIEIRELYLSEEVARTPEAQIWVESAGSSFVLDPVMLEAIAPTRHGQGVLAVAEERRWSPWTGSDGVTVFLEGIQDPGNLGAIIRSAAGLGAEAVLLSPGCADPWGSQSVRGSAGSVFRVPVVREVALADAVERIRRGGGAVWATGPDGVPLESWTPSDPLLVLFGAEGRGLSEAARTLAGRSVTIGLDREVESLNVAVAAGILLARLRGLR